MSPAPGPDVTEQLLRHVTGARWFGGKGRRAAITSKTPLPWLTPLPAGSDGAGFDGAGFDGAGPAVRLEIVGVGYPDAPLDAPDLYQLALAYRPAPHSELQHAEVGRWVDAELGSVVAYDATQDPVASAVLLRSLLAEQQLCTDDTQVSFHLSGAEGLGPDLEPSVFRGQQSNTSVMYGEVAMLKLFRRLELGRNLDIEVHDALSGTPSADVARLFGWVQASWAVADQARGGSATVTADLAMVVELLADATDGWEMALRTLRAGTGFVDQAHALGAALASTHAALRQAFPAGRRPGGEVAAVMTERLHTALATAPALEPHVAALSHVFDALTGAVLDVQRVHGDFHLGQTLLTPDGVKIIDFEGEPVKTLAERAAPDSIWRDIAAMLRSFGYAAASVSGPGSHAWEGQAREAFLTGYAGGPLHPADALTLRAYEADKAVYEVVYEVRLRPGWVAIPLGAVAHLTGPSPTKTKE